MTRTLFTLSSIAILWTLALAHAQQGKTATPAARAAAPSFDAVSIRVLPVQRSVYMLVGAGGNITVQVGNDGVLMVDTQYEPLAPKIVTAVRTLSDKPLHTIINTHLHADHTGGTGSLVKMLGGGPQAVRVMAHENVLSRMQRLTSTPDAPVAALSLNAVIVLPVTSTYFTPSRDFFLNGEAVVLYHAPAAHTDGDTMVYFRGSDVISAGDVFTPDLWFTVTTIVEDPEYLTTPFVTSGNFKKQPDATGWSPTPCQAR